MVSCRELTQLYLDSWLSGELPPRRRRECAAHLDGCPDCARYVADYRRVVGLLQAPRVARAAKAHAVPEELVQAILRECGT